MTGAEWRTKTLARWLLRHRPRPKGTPRWALGIYKADRLGDFVLALGAIRRLVESARPRRTVLVITPSAAELATREFPEVDQVIVDPCRSGVGAAALDLWRRRHEDLLRYGVQDLVCLRHHRLPAESVVGGRIPAVAAWGMAHSRLSGNAGKLASMPLDHEAPLRSALAGECLELAQHRSVVEAYLSRSLLEGELTPVLSPGWVGSGPAAVVSPFGSHPIRTIPFPLLAAAGRHLKAVHGLRMDLLCPPGEEARFNDLEHRLRSARVEDIRIVPCATIEALRENLRHSRLVLSAETGTAHLAAALDAPLVGFVGGGHLGWFAPWSRSQRQRWITQDVPCQGCLWNCSQPEPICLTRITEQQVTDAIDQAQS
jgi:ADP-heptose:LPS heptosyltransferase